MLVGGGGVVVIHLSVKVCGNHSGIFPVAEGPPPPSPVTKALLQTDFIQDETFSLQDCSNPTVVTATAPPRSAISQF